MKVSTIKDCSEYNNAIQMAWRYSFLILKRLEELNDNQKKVMIKMVKYFISVDGEEMTFKDIVFSDLQENARITNGNDFKPINS